MTMLWFITISNFPGVVTKIIEDENNGCTYLVNAMQRVGKKWHWPVRRETLEFLLEEEANKMSPLQFRKETAQLYLTKYQTLPKESWPTLFYIR